MYYITENSDEQSTFFEERLSSFAIQRQIPLIPLKRVHPRNIPQHAFEPYNVGGGQLRPPVAAEHGCLSQPKQAAIGRAD